MFTKMHKWNTIKKKEKKMVNLGLLEHKLHVLIQRLKNKANVKVLQKPCF